MEDATSQTLRLPPLPAPTSDSTPSHCFASVSGFVTVLKTPAGHGIHTGASPASAAVLANICLTRCSLASVNTLSSFKPQINMILPLSFQILPSSHMPRFQIYRHIPDRTYVHRDSEASRSVSTGPRLLGLPHPALQTVPWTHSSQVVAEHCGDLVNTGTQTLRGPSRRESQGQRP